MNYKRCDAFRLGRIRKLGITYSAKNGDKSRVDLQMKLHKDGKRYYFSVARYVYYLFVAPFDLEDHTLIVTRMDGNSLNCYFENLSLKSHSEVAIEGFATEKRKSQFQLQVKPVSQYSLEGKFIKQYSTIKEAYEATGILPNYISGAACAKHRTGGGYFWRYGKPSSYIKTASYKKPLDESQATPITKDSYSNNPSHHYLNRNVNSLPGENWKNINGFESLYQVSDHGRVRSMPRPKQVITKNGNTAYHWTRELMMKQSVRNAENRFTGESMSYLTVSLKKEGTRKVFIVTRLVYQMFGGNKDGLESYKVIHKDGDNLNNHISNLEPVAQREIIKTSYQNNRRVSHFATLKND